MTEVPLDLEKEDAEALMQQLQNAAEDGQEVTIHLEPEAIKKAKTVLRAEGY